MVDRRTAKSSWRTTAHRLIDEFESGRRKGKVNQAKLAKMCGVSRQTLWRSKEIQARLNGLDVDSVEASGAEKAWLWVLQSRTGGEWSTEILPGRQTSRVWTRRPPEVIALTAVDRNGNTGVLAVMQVKTR